jgi:hypothetical protein
MYVEGEGKRVNTDKIKIFQEIRIQIQEGSILKERKER